MVSLKRFALYFYDPEIELGQFRGIWGNYGRFTSIPIDYKKKRMHTVDDITEMSQVLVPAILTMEASSGSLGFLRDSVLATYRARRIVM